MLADLMNEDENKDKKPVSESGDNPKKPVIVLPPLGIRTPRPPSSINSSTVATTSPGGGTVVIMPTKPVISMGTRPPPKNPKKRNRSKKSVGEEGQKNVSLLGGITSPGASVPPEKEVEAGTNGIENQTSNTNSEFDIFFTLCSSVCSLIKRMPYIFF